MFDHLDSLSRKGYMVLATHLCFGRGNNPNGLIKIEFGPFIEWVSPRAALECVMFDGHKGFTK